MTYPMVRWQIVVQTQAGHSAAGAMEAVAAARRMAKERSFDGKKFPFDVWRSTGTHARYEMQGFMPGNMQSLPLLIDMEAFSPATIDTMGKWKPEPGVPNQWRVTWLATGVGAEHFACHTVAQLSWPLLIEDPMWMDSNSFIAEFHLPWERPGWKPTNIQWVTEVNQDGSMTPTAYGVSEDTRWFPLSTWPEEYP
jgi:hypothetical protein